MAILTPAQLQTNNAATYTTNGVGSITGANARNFNVDFISSSITVSQTGSMTVLSSSFALTASFAATIGNVVSSSYAATASLLLGSITSASLATTNLYTASVSNNTITFTKGDASTFSLVVATGSAASATFPYTGSAIISGSLQVTGSVYGNVVAVTVASNTASIDLAAGNFFTATLANSATTFFNFTNVRPGVTANLVLTTGTVSTASFSSNVKQPSGSSYLPTSGSGRIDALSVAAVDTSNLYLVASKFFI
jgi:hypothetical protein